VGDGNRGGRHRVLLERLLVQPARLLSDQRFAVAGPQYPAELDWPPNVERIEHVAPPEHARFYARQRFALNVTRGPMVRAGWSPSVRLFEAAACGIPVISDRWDGLDSLFTLGREILVAGGPDDVVRYLGFDGDARAAIGNAARARVLREHTAQHRAEELEAHVDELAAVRA
jgi:spore maturation protein CgeB